MKKLLVLLIIVLGLAAYAPTSFAQGPFNNDVPTPYQTFRYCDWGFLIISEREDNTQSIQITSPTNYSAVQDNSFTLAGLAEGLPVSEVMIVVEDESGQQLLQTTAPILADMVGDLGPWTAPIALSEIAEPTRVNIAIYAVSDEEAIIAKETITLNLNSDTGLRFVDIQSPAPYENFNKRQLTIEGSAGGAFESLINIRVIDLMTDELLAETFATIDFGDEIGTGEWSTSVTLDIEYGTPIGIEAFQTQMESDDSDLFFNDYHEAIFYVNGGIYENMLGVENTDPILMAADICEAAASEFEIEDVENIPLVSPQFIAIADEFVLEIASLTFEWPQDCFMPLRSRVITTEDTRTIDIYIYEPMDESCSSETELLKAYIPLGQSNNRITEILINGES